MNPSFRRLLVEYRDLLKNPEPDFVAGPVDDTNITTWHFTLKGPPDSPYEGGLYHGEIIFPFEYPLKPPDIVFFTENGRFETNQKICLNMTGYHPESWQPSWSVRVILLAIRGYFTEDAPGVGSIKRTPEQRRMLAQKSRNYKCNLCNIKFPDDNETNKANEEIVQQLPKIDNPENNTQNKQSEPQNKPRKGLEGTDLVLIGLFIVFVVSLIVMN